MTAGSAGRACSDCSCLYENTGTCTAVPAFLLTAELMPAELNTAGSILPTFEPVPLLCVPYTERDNFWYVNTGAGADCTAVGDVEEVYGARVCNAPLAPGERPETNSAFRVRVRCEDVMLCNVLNSLCRVSAVARLLFAASC